MSKETPGLIFDASNSWNGYNHQGKLAILFAIKQILEVYDNSISVEINKKNLESYFIEIEYLEDFSLGKINDGNIEYHTVHQVKNHATGNAANYNSALLGLAFHVKAMPTLKKAYLHATTNIDFKDNSVFEYVKNLIATYTKSNDLLLRIRELYNNESKRQELCAKKVGRPENFIISLKQALLEIDDTQLVLDKSNIDKALDALKSKVDKQISDISSLSDEQIEKIDLYLYEIEEDKQNYCEVDKIELLIKKEILKSVGIIKLSTCWQSERYINNRYLYLLGKLDEHIIDRYLNYPLYKNKSLDRKITLRQIYEWLSEEKFDTADEEFYQFQLKDIFSKYTDEFCKKCKVGKCDSCFLVPAINRIGELTKEEMKDFLTLTCPNNLGDLSCHTFSAFLSKSQINNPFLEGIRMIDKPFEEDKKAITYIGKKTLQYILTTLSIEEDQDEVEICTDIIKNKKLYELMMDYDCFISRNVQCPSIQDKAKKIGKGQFDDSTSEERRKEHIAHLKDVSIVTLTDCKDLI